ncbi:hypothetical protein ACFS7Z_22050 [Pontibacter toksunensis]|uniref:Uncharacterized protein n=1 Tax=Pontibacter toksunensis TaxID=1332631 RepID=A0ABW6C352_9BACT
MARASSHVSTISGPLPQSGYKPDITEGHKFENLRQEKADKMSRKSLAKKSLTISGKDKSNNIGLSEIKFPSINIIFLQESDSSFRGVAFSFIHQQKI